MATFTVLEPMSTGDVIDRAVRLYRRNFGPLISIVAVPAVVGYIVKLMVSYGYTSLVMGAADQTPNFRGDAILMLIIGMVGYPIWAFLLLLTISGLSRVVGDHVMLNEPIGFKKCFAAIRKRLGAITLMGLLGIALLFGAYIVFSIFLFVVIIAVTAVAGVTAAARLPQWVMGVLFGAIFLIAAAAAVLFLCAVIARIVFMPQVVMIEGQGAGSALGRAMTLGKGNWYKIGGIALFTYFFELSLLAALTLPVLAGFYLNDAIGPEFFVSPTWSILYTSFGDLAGLLAFPIWVVCFTLLYFDSRVRKEAYDLELLAREVAPGFYWQPAVQTSAFGYPVMTQPGQSRTWVQTSPLGLGGYNPRPAVAQAAPEVVTPLAPAGTGPQGEVGWRAGAADALEMESQSTQERPADLTAERPPETAEHLVQAEGDGWCRHCGAALTAGDLFCMQCGLQIER